MNNVNYNDVMCMKKVTNGVSSVDENASYTIHFDLAEILRVYTEGMVTAYNLGLMERNMRNKEAEPEEKGEE